MAIEYTVRDQAPRVMNRLDLYHAKKKLPKLTMKGRDREWWCAARLLCWTHNKISNRRILVVPFSPPYHLNLWQFRKQGPEDIVSEGKTDHLHAGTTKSTFKRIGGKLNSCKHT